MSQKKGRLTIQCDEMWSFVQCKENKQWLWFALDVESRKLLAHILEATIVPAHRAYGILYRQFIDNVLFVIRISGKPMMKYFRLTGTYPLEKTVGRPVILKDSTLLSGRGTTSCPENTLLLC